MKTIVAQVIIKNNDKILMVQENKEGKKGKWNMPAGKLEEDESIIEAAIREVKEETNLNISINGLIAIEEQITQLGQLIIFYFLGDYISGKIDYDNEEISDVKWMNMDEINSINKDNIRGYKTLIDILKLSEKELISLDRIKMLKEL